MSLKKRDPVTYQKYDEVINTVLKSIAITKTGGKFTPISYRDYDLKHMIKPMNLRVMRVDSIPTGSMAIEALVMEIHSYAGPLIGNLNSFQVKYNQITNTIGFNLQKNYDRNFDQCIHVYQNDDIEFIKEHIDKVMYNFIIKQKILSCTGESVAYEDFTKRHIDLLSMVAI